MDEAKLSIQEIEKKRKKGADSFGPPHRSGLALFKTIKENVEKNYSQK